MTDAEIDLLIYELRKRRVILNDEDAKAVASMLKAWEMWQSWGILGKTIIWGIIGMSALVLALANLGTAAKAVRQWLIG